MNQTINKSRLFNASCFALITTAFSFSIRAGILPQLATDFNLSGEQLGFINSMWFLGFPIAMIVGGLVYHTFGPKNIMMVAFVCHALGIILTLYPGLLGGYTGLLISTFFIGIGNGCTEAACNPMIADTYQGAEMSTKLNRFHMWFPGGIVLGSLLSKFMTDANLGWQAQIWLILIPTVIYAYLFWGQTFPKPKTEGVTSIGKNLQAMVTPLYIFMFACMAITAITEFGPQQWTGLIMSKSGASPMLILALVTGLMAVIRFFAGSIVKKFDQTGVLLGSAILATIGIYLLSTQTGGMAYVAAVFFAMGVALFWPNMIGFVAEKVPLSGALGMSIVGGVGMFSTSIFQPIIGRWIDTAKTEQTAAGLTGDAMELAAGQSTLSTMMIFPLILVVAFTGLYFYMRKGTSAKA
ncbi:sugar MFS transporter [Arcicella rosea]|uniref:MFS family permease n=1 Tax=Arcicella rosea TaxID=502909 RepID=A0A841EF37_9BACT|nr:MFS transporter [Arcicella rosea]MBB6001606.1 MFS family permease [Arcicella rosea]